MNPKYNIGDKLNHKLGKKVVIHSVIEKCNDPHHTHGFGVKGEDCMNFSGFYSVSYLDKNKEFDRQTFHESELEPVSSSS